ncbi:MAG: TIGR04076 family protein [bacterium]
MPKLIIEVVEIKGSCPVYELGDRIVLDEGYRLNRGETDNLCMHSVGSILPYYNSIYRGVDPRDLGLSKDARSAYVQCLDPCSYTGGGTVIFRITRSD